MFKEFKEFAFKGDVIDLAVGIVIGAAFGGDHQVVRRQHHQPARRNHRWRQVRRLALRPYT